MPWKCFWMTLEKVWFFRSWCSSIEKICLSCSQMNKPGYLDEVKSLISEFMQYDIREEELQDMLGKTGEDSLLHNENAGCGLPLSAFLHVFWKVII